MKFFNKKETKEILDFNKNYNDVLLSCIPDTNNIKLVYTLTNNKNYIHIFFTEAYLEKNMKYAKDFIYIDEINCLSKKIFPYNFYIYIPLNKIFYTSKNFKDLENAEYYLLSSVYCMIYQKEINDFLHKIISEYPDNFKETDFIYYEKIKHIITYDINHILNVSLLGFYEDTFTLYGYPIINYNKLPCELKTFSVSDIRKSINGKLYFNKYIPVTVKQEPVCKPDKNIICSSACINDSYTESDKIFLYNSYTYMEHCDEIIKKNNALTNEYSQLNIYTDITDFIKSCTNVSFKQEKYYYICGILFLISNDILYVVNFNENIIIKIHKKMIQLNDKLHFVIYKTIKKHNYIDNLNNFLSANNKIINEFNNFILSAERNL